MNDPPNANRIFGFILLLIVLAALVLYTIKPDSMVNERNKTHFRSQWRPRVR